MSDDGPIVPDAQQGIDRRKFVKNALGAAAIGTASAAGFGMFKQTTVPGDIEIRFVDYLGAKVVGTSPAPRGLPFIPVQAGSDGTIEALPEKDGMNHMDNLRYCGKQSASNLRLGFTDDNVLRYHVGEDKLAHARDRARVIWWYFDRLGEPAHVDDFKDLPHGSGASVRWRSEDVPTGDMVNLLLLKLDPDGFSGPGRDSLEQFMDMEHHLIALSSICTHFCCVPGYKESESANRFNAWDLVYCTCHHSRFDPQDIQRYTFMLRDQKD